MIKLSTLFQVKSVHIFINISLICWASHQIHVLKHWLSELYNSKWAQTRQPLIFKMDVGISENQPRCFSSSSSVEVSQLDGGGHFQSEKKRIFDLGFLWPYFNMISISFKFRVFLSSICHLEYRWDWLKVRKGALYLNDNDSQKGHNSFISSSLSGRVAYLYFMNTLIINETQRIEWNLKHRYWKYHLLQGCNLGSM